MERDLCQKCRDLLDDEWDGTRLGESERELLREHLSTCLACAGLAHDMGRLLASAKTLGEVSYDRPVEVTPLVLRPRGFSLSPWLRGFAASAALSAMVALGFHWGQSSGAHIEAAAAPSSSNAREVVVRVAVPLTGAQSVSLLGDFTGWQGRIPLTRTESGLWVGEVRVPAGRYRYVLVVDESQMQPDPAAPQVVDDGFGGKNSVLDVGSI